MGDNALARIRNKLEKAELDHLRQHSADLAARLEIMEERAIQAESQADWYWQQHTDLIRSLTDQGEEIGLARDGEIGVIAKPDPLALPTLEAGETYVATLFDAANGKGYHLILLPGDNDPANWETQTAWAHSIGGELPTRVEQSLLFAQCKSLFKEEAYWSNDGPESGLAWYQFFDYGLQFSYYRSHELRARAVRRLPIQSFTHS